MGALQVSRVHLGRPARTPQQALQVANRLQPGLLHAFRRAAHLYLEYKDVLDALAVGGGLEVVGVHGGRDAGHLFLRGVVRVLHGQTHEVLPIALDFHPVADIERVTLTCSFFVQLGVVHAGLERVGPALLQALIVIIFPGKPLVDICEVFDQL